MPARSYAVITQSYAVVVTHCPISVFRFPFSVLRQVSAMLAWHQVTDAQSHLGVRSRAQSHCCCSLPWDTQRSLLLFRQV